MSQPGSARGHNVALGLVITVPLAYTLLLEKAGSLVGVCDDTCAPISVLASLGCIAATCLVAGYAMPVSLERKAWTRMALVCALCVVGIQFHFASLFGPAVVDAFSAYIGPAWKWTIAVLAVTSLSMGWVGANGRSETRRILLPVMVLITGLVAIWMAWLPFLRFFVRYYG